MTYTGEGQEQPQRGHLKEGETQKTERQSYDAWGARRNADTWAPAKGPLGAVGLAVPGQPPPEEREGSNLARGYTGHEMLDDVGLIHMNGRLYDPSLGRMCAADPYVQTPENLQNYNRYSYVLNNPLSQIDPSGHFIIGIIAAIVGAILGIIGGIISTVLAFVAYLAAMAAQFVFTVIGLNGAAAAMGSMGTSMLAAAKAGIAGIVSGATAAAAAKSAMGAITWGKVAWGAALGAAYSGGQTAINGGSFSDVLKSAAIGAATGAVGAIVGAGMHGLGDALGSMLQGGNSLRGTVVHIAAHGAAGGGMSEAMGGSFEDGFIGGVIGSVSGGLSEAHFDNSLSGVMAKATIAGVSGGLASVATGGKFGHAAYSAAFFYLFNTQSGFWKKLTQGLDTLDAIAAVADFVPGVSTLKSGLEVITGYDPITGKALSAGDRALSAAGLIPGGKALKYAAKVVNALDTGHDIAKVAARTNAAKTPLALPAPRVRGNNPPVQTYEKIIVDPKGNAIPLKPGETVVGSPDGRFIQVRNASGQPTGLRIDGPHKPASHPDPRAQAPHAHVPGVTNPDGTPWLPVR